MDISCAFASSPDTPDHIALAEQLGYRRAWCYDSPALYPDVWMTLALAAQRTRRIELGPGVLVPNLRHVMTNAAAIATLENLAPGRVVVAIGAGFTGRVALGQRSLPWTRVRAYIEALRALLRGEDVMWDGAVIKMLHPAGFAPPRPIAVPILVGADGPKGAAVAQDLGDGIFGRARAPGITWYAQLHFGTVLDPSEDPGSERVLAAAGHAAAVGFHGRYERGGVEALPGGREWLQQIEALPASTRHLAVHEEHLVSVNAIDRPFITPELLLRLGLAGSVEAQRERLTQLAQQGVTEVAYQPAGPDIPRELTAFARMAGLQTNR
ncbi:MAG: LLM class flavin-dependent oxidoreductase [Dehalococcoidia bacterium]